MRDQQFETLGIFIIILVALASIAILIKRGEAKPGVVLMILLMVLSSIFYFEFKEKGILIGSGSLSGEIVIGVIASLIAGIILLGLRRK